MPAGDGPRERPWQREVDELDSARASGEIDDAAWFAGMATIYEAAYLGAGNPRSQSGFGADAGRWKIARRPIANAIDRDGTFLDIGCASGHLLECIVRWAAPHRRRIDAVWARARARPRGARTPSPARMA